jgi:hypothetical protein
MHKTYYCLEKWNKKLFKKMGYLLLMQLESKKEYSYYVYCLEKFQKCIDEKVQKVTNPDIILDLQILIKQNNKLKSYVTANLKSYFENTNKDVVNYSSYKQGSIGRTSCYLEKWLDKLFQKLGWMIFAIEDSNILKLQNYISSIQILKSILCDKIMTTNDHDNKNNLEILLSQVEILENFVNREISPILQNINIKASTQKNQRTLCQINKWYAALFKKTGWMVLAVAENNKLKVDNYISCINDCIVAINQKMSAIKDIDKQNDLKILNDNILTLKGYVVNNIRPLIDNTEYQITQCSQVQQNILKTSRKLYKWLVRIFKKMGLMVLVARDNDKIILNHYSKNITKLMHALKLKIELLQNCDSKCDLHILKNYISILKFFIDNKLIIS